MADLSARRPRRSRRPRRRVTFTSVVGELLITAGVLVLLFVAWQLWVGDVIYSAQASSESAEISAQWDREYVPLTPSTSDPDAAPVLPVLTAPADTQDFANLYIPRFGDDYAAPVAGGTTRSGTLDRSRVGYYLNTQLPGEPGNFAIAAHRRTYGGYFLRLPELQVGDAIVVEVPEGWFTYRFRNHEYVRPHEVEAVLPVPWQPSETPTESYITLTTCSPLYSLAERLVAYGTLESFTPRDAGPPASLTESAA